jgi:hypothetical protein
MGRKPRPEPFSEGSITEIYKYFFGPLIHYKPALMPIKDWMEILFDLKNREITRYLVERPFHMPGLYYSAPAMKVQGIGYRDVKPDSIIWVRKDARNPDQIDVEFLGGQGKKDQMFQLTEHEWDYVALHCREAERKKKK